MTEQERQVLLDEVKELKKKMAEIGARLAAAPTVAPETKASPTPKSESAEPFSFADFTWVHGNARTKDSPLANEYFTPDIRVDVNYTDSLNRPSDHTISGSNDVARSNEVQLTQLGVGGDFHVQNVRARVMTQFGLYSIVIPRGDASPLRGQWHLTEAYRNLSEAYGGYHIDRLHGINVDLGLLPSFLGATSYYQFDNWAYQPSYIANNLPQYFVGLRVQIYPTAKLKIEPWIVNGWQAYGKFNRAPGVGLQVLWRPTGSLQLLSSQYWGTDTLFNPNRQRIHNDSSIEVKYLDRPAHLLDKAAFTVDVSIGCEFGGGVSCHDGTSARPSQYFAGFLAYNRLWFHKDRFAMTLGGGAVNNPGRYLVQLPPINGATAISGTPYFTTNPGDPFRAWDASATFDYMPSQFLTFRWEYNHRASNVPYFTGAGGITPPGGNIGPPGSFVPGFIPDLRKYENRFTIALLVKL